MKVLCDVRYVTTFNIPSEIRDRGISRKFVNFGAVWLPLGAIAAYSPFVSVDIVHCVNRIPLISPKPWVATFESRLPRTLPGDEWLRNLLRNQLLSNKCLGIIAMSRWARQMFETSHADWKRLPEALDKMRVLHPSVKLRPSRPRELKRDEPIQVLFVGNSFARKGGIVALRTAKRALAEGLNVHFHLVSGMAISKGQHTDYPDPSKYDEDLKSLELPNVTFHGSLTNQAVFELMAKSHFQILATLHDTYGFSLIEGFSVGLPAITSNVCALPEIVTTGKDGYTLELPRDPLNRWVSEARAAKDPDYWSTLTAAYDALAEQAFQRLAYTSDHRETVEGLSNGAIQTAVTRHDPVQAAETLREVYGRAAWSSNGRERLPTI